MYGRHHATGRDGGNSRNGHRAKTVLTEVGPVEIDVPRDRDATFEPKIVAKWQRRLSGVDELVISLSAKGLTTGEVAAHLAEVYGAQVSRQTISTITDKVVEGMAEWQNRPLDPCSEVSAHSWMFPGLEAFRASSEVGSVCSAGIWRQGSVLRSL